MMRLVTAALMILGVGFAGCVGGPSGADAPAAELIAPMAKRAGVPSIPAELAEIRPFEASAPDGVALRGHVYLPAGDGPFATILEYVPYWNQGGSLGPSDGYATQADGRQTMRGMYQHLIDHGYAVAFVNARGSGLSEGCFSYVNFEKDGPDANAVVDALAAQGWSNGRVGMLGISYGAATQYAAVASHPSERLAAAVAVSGEWDEWNMAGEWGTADTAFYHPMYRNVWQGLGVMGPTYGMAPTTNWCPETAEDAAGYWDLAVSGDKTPFFQGRDLRDGLATTHVPFFYTFGLTDCDGGHKRQAWDLWDVLPEDIPKRAMLGEWCHEYPTGDEEWFLTEHALPWFDHFLRGGPAVETGVVDYLTQQEWWHTATAWPPEGEEVRLYLSDGTLVLDGEDAAVSDHVMINFDRSNGRPSYCNPGGLNLYFTHDDAIFTSPPLAHDVLLAGEFHMNFSPSSSEPNGNVHVSLYATDEVDLCEDPFGDASLLRHGRTDLRHRGHLFQGEDFPVHQPTPMHVRGLPMATTVLAGQRLVISISAGTPDTFPAEHQPIITVHTGPQTDSFLSLNVVDGQLAFEAD